MNSSLQSYLASTVGLLPMLLVFAGGVILALVNRSRHPLPSLLVLIASAALLVMTLVQPALTTFVVHRQAESGSFESRAMLLGILGILFGVLRAGAYALLVAAAFVRRSETVVPPLPPSANPVR